MSDVEVAWARAGSVLGSHIIGQEIRWHPGLVSSPLITLISVPESDVAGRLSGFRWAVDIGEGDYHLTPPFDYVSADWSVLPRMPGVDLTFGLIIEGGLFEDVLVAIDVTSGQPVHVDILDASALLQSGPLSAISPVDSLDAWFRFSLGNSLRARLGLIPPVSLVNPPGEFGGELDAAMLVAGLIDDAWMSACGLPAEVGGQLLEIVTLLDGRKLLPPEFA